MNNGNILTRFHGSVGKTTNDDTSDIVVPVECGSQHLQWCRWITGRLFYMLENGVEKADQVVGLFA